MKNFTRFLNRIFAKFGFVILRSNAKVSVTYPEELCDEIRRVIGKIIDDELTMTSPERLFSTALSMIYVIRNKIPGDFVECGVWRGGNAILASAIIDHFDSDKHIWLFDTFDGMPSPGTFDISPFELPAHLQFNEHQIQGSKWLYSNLVEVKKNFENFSLTLDAVHFRSGKVEESLFNGELPKNIAVLRLDTDWYESTKVEMQILYPLVQKGGHVIFDDYGYWSGSRKAIDEYFDQQPPFLFYIDIPGRMMIK